MKKGLDASVDLTRFASSLKAKGYDFAGRYYNINSPSKNLSLAEAHILSKVGLNIVAVWENGFPTTTSYFNYAKGVHDGTSAYHYASEQIGQPGQTPIYFAVDFDASNADINAIIQYFKGIQDAYNTISQNNPVYSIGVYGSGLVCSKVLDSNIATFAWLSQSSGWQGSGTFNNFNIKQGLDINECPELGGVNVDPDESPNDNEGSFLIS